MSIKLNFNELPTNEFENGLYEVLIKEFTFEKTKNGLDAFVAHLVVPNTSHSLNEYLTINQANGTPHAFGRKKLRSLIEATGVEIDDITLPLLNTLLKNKRVKADLEQNDRGYASVVYDQFYPLSHAGVPLNAQAGSQETAKESTPPTVTEEVIEEVSPRDFEDEDI